MAALSSSPTPPSQAYQTGQSIGANDGVMDLVKSGALPSAACELGIERWVAARGIGADEIVPWWDYAKVMQGCTDYVKTHQ